MAAFGRYVPVVIQISTYVPPVAGAPLPEGTPVARVHAYCGFFVGAPKWHGTEVYEPDECSWEGDVDVDADTWAEGCVSARCPDCNATLCQADDHFELVHDVPPAAPAKEA